MFEFIIFIIACYLVLALLPLIIQSFVIIIPLLVILALVNNGAFLPAVIALIVIIGSIKLIKWLGTKALLNKGWDKASKKILNRVDLWRS